MNPFYHNYDLPATIFALKFIEGKTACLHFYQVYVAMNYRAFGPGGEKLGCSCIERGWPHTFGCGYTGEQSSAKRARNMLAFCPGVFALVCVARAC
jgi:hypothetical protein